MTAQNSENMSMDTFLESWSGEDQPMRSWFQLLYDKLKNMEGVSCSFVARPGVSYSLRPRHVNQTTRELFAIVDVIDDDPEERWLSVCFYGDMISDPEERGELIPGGLAGSDGYCFDMFEDDEVLAEYLAERLDEAGRTAAQG